MEDLRDAPDIANALKYGYPTTARLRVYLCPECDSECETLYIDRMGDVLGCDCCVKAVDAWDYYDSEGIW